MARRLAATVFVDGVPYPGGSVPPAEVAAQITNESAWELVSGDEPAEPVVPDPAPPRKRAAKKAAAKPAQESGAAAGGDQSGDVTPPAPDAPVEQWREFAATVGVMPADDADAEAIRADLLERQLIDAEA